MFDEVPSKRITERRTGLVMAIYGGLGILSAVVGLIWRKEFGWFDFVIALFMLFCGVVVYQRLVHEDPWTPPEGEHLITELGIESKK